MYNYLIYHKFNNPIHPETKKNESFIHNKSSNFIKTDSVSQWKTQFIENENKNVDKNVDKKES